VVLSVRVVSRTDGDVVLEFAVRDTGIGIPEDQLTRIFEAFEQVDSTLTRRFGGTGLGLAICRKLIELMGGRIWAESCLGAGSTFRFTCRFPYHTEPRMAGQAAALVPGTRVLIVDDHATTRRILTEMLASWDMVPTAVARARDALELLEQARPPAPPFQLVITDVNMPDVDGFTLVETIRSHPATATLPVVLLTSTHLNDEAAQCDRLQITAQVSKPVKQSDLLDAIAVAMQGAVPALGVPPEPLGRAAPLPRLRILLAEDSLMNQRLALGLLGADHDVTVAGDGHEALKLVEQESFDLVLMDVQMPLMDGLEATRAIRARERTTGRHVPIVAMTAHAMKGDRERCLAAGMDHYISKPIRAARLMETIGAAMGRGGPLAEGLSPGAGAGHAGEVVDWSEALRSVNGDQQLLRDIVEAFLDESPRLLATMRSAIDQRDGKTLQRAAHTLKGSTRYFGATRVSELALQLETMGARANLAHACETLQDVEREMARLTPLLIDYMRGRAAVSS
jgi:CheY-like chemotaxis protein